MGFQNSSSEMQMSLEVVFGGGNRIGDWAEKMVWKREIGIKQRPSTPGQKMGSTRKKPNRH